MAVKDIYIPYEDWIKQVFLVEDYVIQRCLCAPYMSAVAQETFGNHYFLKYPFNLSYAQYCLSFQDKQYCSDIIKKGLDEISHDGQEAAGIKFGVARSENALDEFKDIYTDYNIIKFDDPDNDELTAFVTSWDIHIDHQLPLATSEFTLSEYLKKRFNPFFRNAISSETYERQKDSIAILNQDRNNCVMVPNNFVNQVEFIGMPNFYAMCAGAGLLYKFGIKFSDELVENGLPSWIPLGDVDKDKVEETVIEYSNLLHSGETTIYYGEFYEY